jgi:hypothetical protein|tara:strand:- start:888 stop:1148 length:261 start_codon:yes stop_codon:yes gene_type:complete
MASDSKGGGTFIPGKVWLGIWASVTATLCVALIFGAVSFYSETAARLTQIEVNAGAMEEHVKGELHDQGEILDQIYDIVNTAHPRQ